MHRRVEICGGIASGKTTLAQIFGGCAVFENFQENPFWRQFYKDPVRFAFETEVSFLLQHYSLIKDSSSHPDVLIFDFSPLQDMAYADVNLSSDRLCAFRGLYKQVMRELNEPDVLVHLVCEAKEELERIRQRARAAEESIHTDYLEQLNEAIDGRVASIPASVYVLTIDSEANDFANDPHIQSNLRQLILDAATTSRRPTR